MRVLRAAHLTHVADARCAVLQLLLRRRGPGAGLAEQLTWWQNQLASARDQYTHALKAYAEAAVQASEVRPAHRVPEHHARTQR